MTDAEKTEFFAAADSRETSVEVMQAIAFHALDTAEADAIWEGSHPYSSDRWRLAVWETATGNGMIDDTTLFWGGRTLAALMEV